MNRAFLPLFFALVCMAFSTTMLAQYPDLQLSRKAGFLPSGDLGLHAPFYENSSYADWDLTYNRIHLRIDPAVFFLSGLVDVEFVSKVPQLSSVTIDLHSALTVKSVESGTTPLAFTRQGHTLLISLPSALGVGQKGSFSIAYEGVPANTGLGSIFQSQIDNSTMAIATLSEPYGARDWWPCKQSLVDKIDSIDIIVDTPSKYRTASNGVLVSDQINGTRRVCHWKHRHPIAAYLVFFSSTTYDSFSTYATLGDGTKVEILNYVYPANSVTARMQTAVTGDYIEFFSRKFIDYPFKNEKYGHAQFSWGGGMEHQTMSSMGGFQKNLIAHELAHQWFGDYITCGSWNEIWLNEGFASYLEALTFEEFSPDSWRQWKEYTRQYIMSEPDGAVYCNDVDNIDRIFDSRLSYDKGSYVLHMLRGQLGDSPFFDGMRRYLTDPRVTNGFATTDLFRDNMEKAAGISLAEFFNDWVYGEGYPEYNIQYSYFTDRLEITVNQSPSLTGGPFFEMKLPFTLDMQGRDTTLWLDNTRQGQVFSIPYAAAPTSVTFNAEGWVLCNDESGEVSAGYSSGTVFEARYLPGVRQVEVLVPEVRQADGSVYDTMGRRLKTFTWSSDAPRIDVGDLPRGTYLFVITAGNGRYSTRLACY